jgi:hypothetical protein
MNTNGSTFNVGDLVEYTGPVPGGGPKPRGTIIRPQYTVNWDAGSGMDVTKAVPNNMLKLVNNLPAAAAAGRRRRTKKSKSGASRGYY